MFERYGLDTGPAKWALRVTVATISIAIMLYCLIVGVITTPRDFLIIFALFAALEGVVFTF